MYRFLKRKGMSTPIKILFGILLMVAVLLLLIMMANTLAGRGMDLAGVLSVENFIPGGGGG